MIAHLIHIGELALAWGLLGFIALGIWALINR